MNEEQIRRLNEALAPFCPDTIDMFIDNWVDTLEQVDPDEAEDC